MHKARICSRGLVIGALAILVSPVLADARANEIMKKAEAAMNGVTTYQGTWVMNMSMGKAGTMSMNMDMKMKPKEGKMAMKMSPNGTPTGQMAMAGAALNMQMVDDGKNSYMYMPAMGGYQKGPHKANSMKPGDLAFKNAGNVDTTFVRTESVAGRPAFVLKMTAKNNPKAAGANTLVYIDQATYRFKKMTVNSAAGGMPMNMIMTVKNDVVNVPIPDSAFHFVPPPGVKEVKGSPMGAMGMPGFGGMGGPAAAPHK